MAVAVHGLGSAIRSEGTLTLKHAAAAAAASGTETSTCPAAVAFIVLLPQTPTILVDLCIAACIVCLHDGNTKPFQIFLGILFSAPSHPLALQPRLSRSLLLCAQPTLLVQRPHLSAGWCCCHEECIPASAEKWALRPSGRRALFGDPTCHQAFDRTVQLPCCVYVPVGSRWASLVALPCHLALPSFLCRRLLRCTLGCW